MHSCHRDDHPSSPTWKGARSKTYLFSRAATAPPDDTSAELIARRHGPTIEMEGKLSGGTPVRWHIELFAKRP